MTEHKQPPTANSLQEIIEFVESLNISKQGAWFRGHSDSSFELIPSVFRKTGKNGDGPYYNENELLNEFLRRHPTAKKEHSNTLELLTYAQHYGLPTRLLDWSENLLVAIYFACNEFEDKEGELFVWLEQNPKPISTKSFFSSFIDKIIEIDNKPELIDGIIGFFKEKTNSGDYIYLNETPIKDLSLNRFLELSNLDLKQKLTLSYKVNNQLTNLDNIHYKFYPPLINKRLISQGGCFSVHSGKVIDGVIGLNFSTLKANKSEELVSILINKDSKQKILKSLKICGIDRARLFPELEHQTAVIREQCKY